MWGERGCLSGPSWLPPSRLPSLTHPLHGFQDQSQFIAGHLRAGLWREERGCVGAEGGEVGAAAMPERGGRGEPEEEGASPAAGDDSCPRGSQAAQTPGRASGRRGLKGAGSCAGSAAPPPARDKRRLRRAHARPPGGRCPAAPAQGGG